VPSGFGVRHFGHASAFLRSWLPGILAALRQRRPPLSAPQAEDLACAWPGPSRGTAMPGKHGPNCGLSPALPRGDHDRQRLLALFAAQVDLGRQAAAGAAQPVIGWLGPHAAGRLGMQIFLRAPAACWCARATVESTLTSQVISPAASGGPAAAFHAGAAVLLAARLSRPRDGCQRSGRMGRSRA
jgi:hypothetical protein